jgi:hypothetical protein
MRLIAFWVNLSTPHSRHSVIFRSMRRSGMSHVMAMKT